MYWLGAIVAISILIIVHETGHYLVAKWCKMRVDRFSLGFGPGLVTWKRKGTIFQIAPIPFGGFVEIRGMNVVEEVDPDDIHAYPNRPAWQRFITIFAGPATNYLFAIVLAFILYSIAGVQTGNEWYLVDSVAPGFDAQGKLEPGDRIVSIQRRGDLEPIPIYQRYQGKPGKSLAEVVHESKGEPLEIVVMRQGKELPPIGLQARQDPEVVFPGTDDKQYRLGIGLAYYEERAGVGVFTAIGHAAYYPVAQTKLIAGLIRDIFTGKQEGRLTGPVGIAKTFKKAFEIGWITALQLFMVINVWLGLVNLLPLPALDGGRLVFLVYEMATRRRPNPKIEATVHMVGIMALLLLMVAVTYGDCTTEF
jgi:regulator of sigma E protease